MNPPHLSFIIPVFNEKKRLKRGLKVALKYLSQQKYSWELILVDDGSTDNSLGNIDLKSQNTFLIRTHKNFGKGHALRLGVEAASGKHIIFSDIDFSVPINYIHQFLTQLKSYPVIIGSRRLGESSVKKHQPKLRESLGHAFTMLSNLILSLNHSDHTCGFKAFKSSVAKKLFKKQKINGWAYDSEILFLAQQMKIKIKEIPVKWQNDPNTKVKIIPDTIKSLFSLFYIRLTCNG